MEHVSVWSVRRATTDGEFSLHSYVLGIRTQLTLFLPPHTTLQNYGLLLR